MSVKANSLKTHCLKGHPLTGENLYVYTGGNGRPARGCKTCNRERSRSQSANRRKRMPDVSRVRFDEMVAWPMYPMLKAGIEIRAKDWPKGLLIKLDESGVVRYGNGQIFKITEGPIDQSKWEIV